MKLVPHTNLLGAPTLRSALLRNKALVLGAIRLAGVEIDIWLNAKRHLDIVFLIRDGTVGVLREE